MKVYLHNILTETPEGTRLRICSLSWNSPAEAHQGCKSRQKLKSLVGNIVQWIIVFLHCPVGGRRTDHRVKSAPVSRERAGL